MSILREILGDSLLSHVLYFRQEQEEGTMIERADRKGILQKVSAGFLILTIPLAGLIFGATAGEDGAGSGQIQPGTSLAAKIEKKALVHVVTPSGTKEIRQPLIVPEGLKSQIVGSTPIPWDEIQKIRYQGRATMTGMWIGFGIGAAFGTTVCLIASAEGLEDIFWYYYPLTIAAGAVIGAGSGALIGALFPKWRTLYDAPAGPPMVARVSLAPTRRGGAMTLTLAF
jgi:hypothetical protein